LVYFEHEISASVASSVDSLLGITAALLRHCDIDLRQESIWLKS